MAKVTLSVAQDEARKRIDDLIERGVRLRSSSTRTTADSEVLRTQYLTWDSDGRAVLENTFDVAGFLTSNPASDFSGTGLSLLDLRVNHTVLPLERAPEVLKDISEKLRVLEAVKSRLSIYEVERPTAPTVPSVGASIFLVHGHDLARREVVRRFLESITTTPVIVLDEQPNEGRDVLGKLLDNASQAAYAVVLMTGDDEGRAVGSGQLLPRARQNVILELGLFLGLLGRKHVAALFDESVDMPSDYKGVAWIPLAGETWMVQLARELKAIGLPVSLDSLL